MEARSCSRRVSAPRAKKLKEFHPFPQPPFHHFWAANHLRHDVADLAPTEIEAFVKVFEGTVNLRVSQMRIVQGRNLDAPLIYEFGIRGIQPAVLYGLFVEKSAWIWRRQRNLNRMWIDSICKAHRLFDCLECLTRQT